MNYYRYHGSDSGSDAGCWTVVVKAKTNREAERMLREHLAEMGREDLWVEKPDVEGADGVGIVHSDVQAGGSS